MNGEGWGWWVVWDPGEGRMGVLDAGLRGWVGCGVGLPRVALLVGPAAGVGGWPGCGGGQAVAWVYCGLHSWLTRLRGWAGCVLVDSADHCQQRVVLAQSLSGSNLGLFALQMP